MRAVDELSFAELVAEFAESAVPGTPVGLDLALERQAVERRLMALLTTRSHDVEHRQLLRVPGEVAVHIQYEDHWTTGGLVDLGEGGLNVRALVPLPVGALVDVEVLPESPTAPLHLPRARAVVAWVNRRSDFEHDCGLTFVAHGEAERRHVRRVMVSLLRRLAAPAPDALS